MRRLLVLLIFASLYGCSGAPYVVQPQQETNRSLTNKIYVVSHGWHTGLVVPASRLHKTLPSLSQRFGNPAFYEIGWGDKDFYQAKEITTGITLQAMFWATGASIHVVAIPYSPYQSFPHSEISESCISEAELSSLMTFLSDSFVHDESGRMISLAPGIYGDAQFYDGVGRYHIFNTCNKWTAKGLSSAGYDLSPTFKLTAGSIMSYLTNNPRECSPTISGIQSSAGKEFLEQH
jgi:uncharacterized protein (TIGR02117 family)